MRRALFRRIVPLSIASALLSGCIYTNVQRPLGTEFNRTELGSKSGKASSRSILWLVAWGDAGTKAAADAGGIRVIHHGDVRLLSILFGLYSQMDTIIYGD